jgi:hypothetical protein
VILSKGRGIDAPTCACSEYLDLEIVNGELMCEDCRDSIAD